MSDYTKKTWQNGDVITSEAMNNIENGVDAATQVTNAVDEHFDAAKGMKFVVSGKIAPTIGNTSGAFVSATSQSLNGTDYTTEVSGGVGKIVCGIAKTSNKDFQLVLGQVTRGNQAFATAFPFLSDYYDAQYVFKTQVDGDCSIVAGPSIGHANYNLVVGVANLAEATENFIFGQNNHTSSVISAAIGEELTTNERSQVVVGVANDNKTGDIFEVGNGTYVNNPASVSRSNAFRVTKTGSAIAQTSLGIEDGNGGVVTITAAQLQALLALIPQNE